MPHASSHPYSSNPSTLRTASTSCRYSIRSSLTSETFRSSSAHSIKRRFGRGSRTPNAEPGAGADLVADPDSDKYVALRNGIPCKSQYQPHIQVYINGSWTPLCCYPRDERDGTVRGRCSVGPRGSFAQRSPRGGELQRKRTRQVCGVSSGCYASCSRSS